MTRGLGLVRDRAEHVDEDNERRHLGGFLGSSNRGLPLELSYATWLDRIIDQGGTNSCVGCAISTAVYLRMRYQIGRAAVRPSPKGIYDVARLIDRPGLPLLDNGCRPRAAIAGAQHNGLVSDDRWPLIDETVNVPPPFDVFAAGVGAILTGHYRADSGDIPWLLRRALSLGHFPVFGMLVPESYAGWVTGDIFNADRGQAPDGLGHMQAICGYGEGYFEVVSSWGYGHGMQGIVRIADDFVASAWAFDRLVITAVPSTLR